MLTRMFIYAEDPDRELTGWRLVDHPWFDPVKGRGTAHDTLEHRRGDKGTVAEEMMALGAVWWIRIETGYLMSKGGYGPDAGQPLSLSQDLLNTLLTAIHAKDNLAKACVPAYPKRGQRLDEDFEAQLEALVTKGIDLLCEELGYAGHAEEDLADIRSAANLKAIRDWMRAGYRDARRRYPDPYLMSYTVFEAIEKAADEADRVAEIGDLLKVSVSIKHGAVTVTHLPGHPEEEDYAYY